MLRRPRAPVSRSLASLAISLQGAGRELELRAFHLEELLVLPDQGVLRLGQDADQRVLVERVERRQHRQTADELGDHAELDQVVAGHLAEQFAQLLFAVARSCAPKPMVLRPMRRAMMLSRPTNVPPQMNRMFDVSTWMYCCSGCLRPPCGGTLLTVPSSILSRACCTPSPETSRVMLTFWLRLGDLVHLVDVDDAALGRLDVEVGGVQQLQQQVLDVLADVAGLGQRGGVADGEGHVEDAGERPGQERLAAAGRADEQDVALIDLDVAVAARRRG